MNIQLADYIPNSLANGEGVRDVIFFSGCSHNCKNCHNQAAQDFLFGELVDHGYLLSKVMNNFMTGMIDGITISGGDPFYQYLALLELCKALKRFSINVWVYTGFYYDELVAQGFGEVLKYVDVLVDGAYDENKPENNGLPRGSTNQSIIRFKHNGIIDKERTVWGN